MANHPPNREVGPLLHAMFARDSQNDNDGQLLRRFLTERDEAAFAALVKRHGPMVLAVCRRVLGNAADAEDAFQATFVVLVRKAPKLASRPVVGDWLHGVARRIALQAKATAATRRAKERAAARPETPALKIANEWLPRLDDELSRLPEKYRLCIVLCDLEGKTRGEAAHQLGWPEGTVAGRLARGRALLAKRLLRGAQIHSTVLAGALAANLAQAAMPLRLVHATVQTAVAIAVGNVTGQGVLSAEVLTLAKGAMRSMFWNKIKFAMVVLLATAVFGGAGGWTYQMLAAGLEQPQPARAEPTRIAAAGASGQAKDKKAPTERDKALLQVAKNQYETLWKHYTEGKVAVDQLPEWSIKWLKADLKVLAKKSEVVAVYKAHLERMAEIEKIAKRQFEGGVVAVTHYNPALYNRIQAEIWLDEAQAAK